MIGSFDSQGCPNVDIEVSGPFGHRTKFTALLDTGFSGFLLLPLFDAIPIGLILQGTMSVILADGSKHAKLTCAGMVHCGVDSEIGTIILEPEGDGVLLGMDFLRKFRLQLVLDPSNGTVQLNKIPPAPTTPTSTVPPATAPNPPATP